LTEDGEKIDRRGLGSTGGGVVKLWPDAEVTEALCIGEGVETCLAAAMTEWPPGSGTLLRPIWATLSTGTMRGLPVLPGIEALTIVVDNDPADDKGRRPGPDAAAECTKRWVAAGVSVMRLTPKANEGAP
jgi:hypothetical protein